jgi:hypothetical protein
MIYSHDNAYYELLDGLCAHVRDWGGRTGVWISGNKVKRYVLYKLGVQQPPLFKGEESIATLSDLELELTTAKRNKVRRRGKG